MGIEELRTVSCLDCCEVHDCESCLELAHEDCDLGECPYCQRIAKRRERQRYADAQVEYYRPGGFFDTIMGGMEEQS